MSVRAYPTITLQNDESAYCWIGSYVCYALLSCYYDMQKNTNVTKM